MTQSTRWTAELRTAWPSLASLTTRCAGSEPFSPCAPPLCLGSQGSSWFVSGGRCLVLDLSWITATDWMQPVSSLFVCSAGDQARASPFMQGMHSHWAPASPVLVRSYWASLFGMCLWSWVFYSCCTRYCVKTLEQDCVQSYPSLKDNTLCTHPVSELLCYLRTRILLIQMTAEFLRKYLLLRLFAPD